MSLTAEWVTILESRKIMKLYFQIANNVRLEPRILTK